MSENKTVFLVGDCCSVQEQIKGNRFIYFQKYGSQHGPRTAQTPHALKVNKKVRSLGIVFIYSFLLFNEQ